MSPLIDADRLIAEQNGPDAPLVLDCTYHIPGTDGDAAADFAKARIPGAIRFDVDALSRTDTDLPHMLPPPADAAPVFAALGIEVTKPVVVYDRTKFLGAARAWWTFRVYGLPEPRVLDGGLKAWIAAGGALESGAAAPPGPTAPPKLSWTAALYADEAAAAAALADDATTVLDARPAARFAGDAPEPRAGLRAGHMPGAKSLPFTDLLDADDRLVPTATAGRTIATCGSGVSACVLALAAAAAGAPDVAIYDASWSEWGRAGGPPVER